MAATLTASSLADDSRRLLADIADKMSHSGSPDLGEMVQASRRTASQRMLRLVDELNRRLFPHRYDTKPESTDTSALVRSLQEQLKSRPAPSLDAVAETKFDAAPEQVTPAPEAKLGGETKPEHASPEALSNPFSLVNIQRGAARGAVMTTTTTTTEQGRSSVQRKGQKQIERATVSYKKKLVQLRFSRRRYLRDYRGTNLLTVILLFIVLLSFNIGTVFTNVSVLIPQTVDNRRAGEESQTFLRQIDRDQPKLAALLSRRQKMNAEVEEVLQDFDTVSEIREDFANFITLLDDNPGINLVSQQINETGGDLPDVSVVAVSLELETSFLLWLRLRNKMLREIGEINITDEVIIAPPGVPQINISVSFSKPGRTK
ncbi:MAG: hypothetical protein ACON4P_09795 [Candidatus Puniceispirillales bacterium]